MPVTRYQCVLVLATALAALAGCAPESINDPPDTAVRIPDAEALTGTVTTVGDDALVIDIGTARPVTVALAEVAATNCGSDGAAEFAAGLREVTPVGREVVVVRAKGSDRPGHDLIGFVYPRGESDTPVPVSSGMTVNEVLVRTGRARVDPPIERAATATALEDQVAARVLALPAPDGDYLPLLVAAETQAWTGAIGPIGACARQQLAVDRGRATIATPPPGSTSDAIAAPPETNSPPSQTDAANGPDIRVSPASPEVRVEITVERPGRPRICERLDRC